MIEKKLGNKVSQIVAHTHVHSDHTAADNHFKNKENTTVVGLTVEEVTSFLKLKTLNSYQYSDIRNHRLQ